MGAGDDTFVWNPGDASDIVEGQGGFDTLQFNGANVAESIEISANGERVRLARDIGGVTMDLRGVEQVDVAASGAPDRITVDDLAGTDAAQVSVDLGIAGGVGDGASDTVTVKAGSGDDVVTVVGDANGVSVLGLAAQVDVQHAEAANDTLEIVTGSGEDVITGTGLAAGTIRLVIDAGDGDDILLSRAGSSVLHGGAGDDILIGGPGDDVLDGGPGNDILIGGGGNDTFLDGNVEVQGFQAGAGFGDRIDVRDVSGLTFDWLIAHAETVDGNAVWTSAMAST